MRLRGGLQAGMPLVGSKDVRPETPLSYPPRRRCATPGCGWALTAHTRSGLHGAFRPPCAARLAAIRDEFDAEPRILASGGRRSGRRRRRVEDDVDELLEVA